MSDVKGCPFCDGPAGEMMDQFGSRWARCRPCGVDYMPIETWNQRASQTGSGEAVAWFIDVPDEPELGHWLAEEPCGEGYRSRALVFAHAARAAMGGKE